MGADSPVDLVLLSSMLKDISRVEADVVSHGEAVLNGRLSKSQQRLIQVWHKLNFISSKSNAFKRISCSN